MPLYLSVDFITTYAHFPKGYFAHHQASLWYNENVYVNARLGNEDISYRENQYKCY